MVAQAPSPSAFVRRLRSDNPLIDLREAPAEAVADLSVLGLVAEELDAFGPPRNLRVWVLHEAAVHWTDDVDAAQAATRALHHLSRARNPNGDWVGDAAVLFGTTRANAALIHLLRSLGITPSPPRSGGGLPVHEVDFGEGLLAGMTGQPCPGEAPPGTVIRHLNDARDGLQQVVDEARALALSSDPAAHERLATVHKRLATITRTERDYLGEVLRRFGSI